MSVCQPQPEPDCNSNPQPADASCPNCDEFMNCDDEEEGDCMPNDFRAGLARKRRARWRIFVSRASTVGLPKGDTGAEAANEKISKEAKQLIKKLYKQVDQFFVALKKCPCMIDKYDFSNVGDLVTKVKEITENMKEISKKLSYSPLITELTDLCDLMDKILDYAAEIPALVYVRLVDITFCLHEFGALLQEVLLPIDFAFAVQKIHTHLRKLKPYGVLKQVIFVPTEYDAIVAPYYKDPRLRRLEQLTNCKITMVRPDDPRAVYCPVNFRTIEVEFDEKYGRYIGFAHLLNRCLSFRTSAFPTRGSEIVVKRFATNTTQKLEPAEVEPLRQRLSRTMLAPVEADMVSGTKTAAIAPEDRVKKFVS